MSIMSTREFVLTKIEQMGQDLNGRIIYLCISESYHNKQLPDLKRNIEDFRSCWKSIKSGHNIQVMLSILSTRIDKSKDYNNMKPKLVELAEYLQDYDESSGEQLANL